MKRRSSLYVKMLVVYLFFAILCFCLVRFYSARMINDLMIRDRANDLYNQANDLTQYYQAHEPDPDDTEAKEEILEYFRVYSQSTNAHIWYVEAHGNIILDSERSTVGAPKESDFNAADFSSTYMVGNYLPGQFSEKDHESITTFATMSKQYKVSGYIVMTVPTSATNSQAYYLQSIVYVTVLIVILLSLVILVAFTIFVYIPLTKVTKVADEYAAGNFNARSSVHTHDEMGYLSATLGYMAQEINNAGEGQRKLVANISHDFRSPLTSIKGYVEAILDGTIPPELQDKYLRIVLDETERLKKLSSNLLSLNTISEKGTYLDQVEFDINHIIRKVSASFEGICMKRDIRFDLVFSNVTLFVFADKDKIQQVLYNLVDNAIKFSPDGSVIEIETFAKHEKAFISVKDSGIGIDKDDISKIWNRFYKTDSSRGKDKKGTGLGLAITKDIIQSHHESIDVISTKGVGTKFTFRLPLATKSVLAAATNLENEAAKSAADNSGRAAEPTEIVDTIHVNLHSSNEAYEADLSTAYLESHSDEEPHKE